MKRKFTIEATPPQSVANAGIYIAMRIARKYQHRLPTVQELMADFGMSRATAYRWQGAMKAATGAPA